MSRLQVFFACMSVISAVHTMCPQCDYPCGSMTQPLEEPCQAMFGLSQDADKQGLVLVGRSVIDAFLCRLDKRLDDLLRAGRLIMPLEKSVTEINLLLIPEPQFKYLTAHRAFDDSCDILTKLSQLFTAIESHQHHLEALWEGILFYILNGEKLVYKPFALLPELGQDSPHKQIHYVASWLGYTDHIRRTAVPQRIEAPKYRQPVVLINDIHYYLAPTSFSGSYSSGSTRPQTASVQSADKSARGDRPLSTNPFAALASSPDASPPGQSDCKSTSSEEALKASVQSADKSAHGDQQLASTNPFAILGA